MYISGSRALLASVAFCAGMAGPALALPLAGGTALAPLGADQTAAAPMAGLLILAEAEGETGNESGDEDAGGTDEGAAEDDDTSLGDPVDGRDGCDNCRGEDETGTDPGDDAGEDVTEGELPDGEVTEGEVTDGEVTDDDGMAWAGGSPDFCEACGGEVVSEETVQTTATRSDRSTPHGTSFSRKERGADLREGCRGTAKVACSD